MAQVNMRMDDDLKKQAEALFDDLGLTMSSAVTIFLKQSIRQGGLPFEVKKDPFFSPANQAFLQKVIDNYESGNSKPVVKTRAELKEMANE